MNLETFLDMRPIILKTISKNFKTQAETLFINAIEQMGAHLEVQEVSIGVKNDIESKQALEMNPDKQASIRILGSMMDPVVDDSVIKTRDIMNSVNI